MKTFILNIFAVLCCLGSPAIAAVVTVETFETGTVGNNLNLDGWHGQRGSGDELFTTQTPYTEFSQGSTTEKIASPYSFPAIMYKPFNSSNTISDSDTDVYIKADLYTGSQPLWVGPHIGGQSSSPYPGTPVMGENGTYWDVWKTDTTDMTGDSWAQWSGNYEVVLQMKINTSDITQSTGTLYRRTLGTDVWTQDSVLHNVNLGLTAASKPSLWNSWWMYGMYNGGVDNLTLGTGVYVKKAIITTENFESGTVGNNLNMDGWHGQRGSGDELFTTQTPYTEFSTGSTTEKIGSPYSFPAIMYKPFKAANSIADSYTDVYIKADLYTASEPLWVGPHIGGQSSSPYPGTPVMGENGSYWDVWKTDTTDLTGDVWTAWSSGNCQLVLQIKINTSDITQSTGTLYRRALGATTWTKDSILQNVNLGLTSTSKPSLWDSWWMYGMYNGGVDNLELGTGFGPEILKAYQPWPVDGSMGVAASTTFKWTSGSYANHWNVYLGTSQLAVTNATTTSAEYKGQVDVNSYSASGLTAGGVYYWRIDDVNGSNAWIQKGNTWSFTVDGGILSTDTQQNEIPGRNHVSWPPITHVKYYHSEYDVNLFSYNPRFTPNVVTFDANNKPYIITGTVDSLAHITSGTCIQTLDSNGRWISLNPSQSIYAKYPGWNGVWEVMDKHIVFDDSDNAYMTILINTGTVQYQNLLLFSKDHCRTWTCYELPFCVRIEHRNGHNDITGPPVLVSNVELGQYSYYGSTYDLKIIIPTNSSGTLTIPSPITIATCSNPSDPTTWIYIVPQHSGDGDVVITKGSYTHVVWMNWKTVPDGNMPCYAATVTRSTGAVSSAVLLGYATSVDHNNDDHQGPVITIDSSNYLHVVLGGHLTQFKYTKSSTANSTQGGWTPSPATAIGTVTPNLGYTYPALACDAVDRLLLGNRYCGDSDYYKLNFMYKIIDGSTWNYDYKLVASYHQYYMCYHQHVNLDRFNRMFLNYDTLYNELDYGGQTGEVAAYKARWPNETLTVVGDPNACNYTTLPHDPVILMTNDGGGTWKIAETNDFAIAERYTEKFQDISIGTAGAWTDVDLSSYGVGANQTVEIGIRNSNTSTSRSAGVRIKGSSIDRRVTLRYAATAGWDMTTMQVKTDANKKIQAYAANTSDVHFCLVGAWNAGSYTEKYQALTISTTGSWTDSADLSTYGVAANNVVEIMVMNTSTSTAYSGGIRAKGSALDRRLTIGTTTSSANECITMLAKVDSSRKLQVYKGNTAVSFVLLGYWTTTPGTFNEKYVDVGKPGSSATWTAKSLSSQSVPAYATCEFLISNSSTANHDNVGVRKTGSSLSRLFDIHKSSASTAVNCGMMHVAADGSSNIQQYLQNSGDTVGFYLLGYWN